MSALFSALADFGLAISKGLPVYLERRFMMTPEGF
jgi:hypothetical protein